LPQQAIAAQLNLACPVETGKSKAFNYPPVALLIMLENV
jgi:hypothetical protein